MITSEQEDAEITEAREADEEARRENALAQLRRELLRARDALGLAEYHAWAAPDATLAIQNARQAVRCAEKRIGTLPADGAASEPTDQDQQSNAPGGPVPAGEDLAALLCKLPAHLHLARNPAAPEHDRWRIYNAASDTYVSPGHATAGAALNSIR